MFLLDTNVVSELRRAGTRKVNRNVAGWAAGVPVGSLFVSMLTLHELEIGVLRAERRDPTKGALLRTWFEDQVLPGFAGRALDVDLAVARRAAALHVPDPRPVTDALLAATALVHGLTLVTRNVADFGATGVRLLDPWADPS
jgi:predicted nucleic acid-binding protein